MRLNKRILAITTALAISTLGVGLASAMRAEDVLLPSYRDTAAQILRGVRLHELLLYWGGDERGNLTSGPAHDFPNCVPVGSHAPHAAGVAYAIKLRRQPRVATCVFGDGATSKGDLWEAMNFAGIHALPVVFLCNNNRWAISVPLKAQTAAETLAQKAIAAGIPTEQVDGNDVIAVRAACAEAIERAREGGGPAFIEALTYRLGDHTTADDASRYREEAEVQAAWKAEPVARLRSYLVAQGAWGKDEEERLAAACEREVDAAIEAYLAVEPRGPQAMFDHLHAELPAIWAWQRAELAGDDDA